LSKSGTAIWFCGLPGSGKSTISKLVVKLLEEERIEAVYLSMDEIRKMIFPNPTYSDEERDSAYRAFVLFASMLCRNGINVILDATAHKKKWRDLAREECRDFVEVYVKCPVEICIERETEREGQGLVRKKLYLDALERLRTGTTITGLGKLPGVDEPFEESPSPEITIDSSNEKGETLARQVVDRLRKLNLDSVSQNLETSS
jgi:adenylylsulfate kinase-like enzyme